MLSGHSDAYLAHILKNLHLGVIAIKPDGMVAYANERASRFLGTTAEQLTGSLFNGFVWLGAGGEILSTENHPVSKILSGQSETYHGRLGILFSETNKQVWFKTDINPEYDGTGQLMQVILSLVEADYDTRPPDTFANVNYGEILRFLPDIIVKVDAQDRLLYYNDNNPGTNSLLDEHSMGKTIFEILPPELHAQVRETLAEARKTRELIRFRRRVLLPDDKYYWYEVRVRADSRNEVILLVRDITEKAEDKDRLSKTVHELQTYLANTPLGYIVCDADFKIIRWSRRSSEIFGYSEEEAIGRTLIDLTLPHAEDFRRIEGVATDLSYGKVNGSISQNRNHKKDGSVIECIWYNSVLREPDGRVSSIMSLVEDITTEKKAEIALQRNERMLSNLISNLPGFVYRCKNDEQFTMLYVSNAVKRITGYTPDELIRNKDISYGALILREDLPKALQIVRDAFQENKPFKTEYRIRVRSGEIRYMSEKGGIIPDEETGEPILSGFIQDVTEIVEARNELQRNYNEKTVLLSEIHHRVKNNLAVVSGFIQLKALENEDAALQELLFESVGRIKSIALIHEQLYASNNFSRIRFDENIENLVNDIAKVMSGGRDIKIVYDLKPLVLDINKAVPCALLINEITTNAFKHAFINKKSGTITLSCSEKDGRVFLSVRDNGVGFDKKNASGSQSGSIGMNIIQLITEQIDGELEIKSEHGTEVIIKFAKTIM